MESSVDAHRAWAEVPQRIRAGDVLPEPWESLFGPLRAPPDAACRSARSVNRSMAASPRRQVTRTTSTDRRACPPASPARPCRCGRGRRRHGARRRPQLTVRRVTGPNPVRVVIDPAARLPATSACSPRMACRRILVTRARSRAGSARRVETIALPDTAGRLRAGRDPRCAVRARPPPGAGRGRCADSLAFLSAGCLDRLHVVVAPRSWVPECRPRPASDRTT